MALERAFEVGAGAACDKPFYPTYHRITPAASPVCLCNSRSTTDHMSTTTVKSDIYIPESIHSPCELLDEWGGWGSKQTRKTLVKEAVRGIFGRSDKNSMSRGFFDAVTREFNDYWKGVSGNHALRVCRVADNSLTTPCNSPCPPTTSMRTVSTFHVIKFLRKVTYGRGKRIPDHQG